MLVSMKYTISPAGFLSSHLALPGIPINSIYIGLPLFVGIKLFAERVYGIGIISSVSNVGDVADTVPALLIIKIKPKKKERMRECFSFFLLVCVVVSPFVFYLSPTSVLSYPQIHLWNGRISHRTLSMLEGAKE